MEMLTAELTPLEGGHTGETFLAVGEDGPGNTVVRLYTGAGRRSGDDAANVDAELLHWMRGLLPVPEVLEVRRPDPELGLPAILVTSLLPGVRADLVLATLSGDRLQRAATELAKVLQRLSLVRTPRRGRFESVGLRLGALPLVWRDPEGFLEGDGRHLMKAWSASERSKLRKHAARAQALLDDDAVSCLVHGDFQPSNVLLNPQTLEVVGVVDWEQAMSGNRFADLGRLLRGVPEPAFADALIEALDALDRALGMQAVTQRLERARAADFVAMVDRASHPDSHPEVLKARETLRRLA